MLYSFVHTVHDKLGLIHTKCKQRHKNVISKICSRADVRPMCFTKHGNTQYTPS